MRTCSLAVVSALLVDTHAFKISSAIDWLYSGAAHAVSADVVSHKVAVIGAGAAGSSSAFWIAKAKSRAHVSVEVDVYEREAYVGGRSTIVYPYNDTTLDPVELGASIFVEANKNLWRATEEFGLERFNFDDNSGGVGFWDGEKFVFSMNGSSGIFGWWESLKAVWRYGILSPRRTTQLVDSMVKQFITLYTPERATWSNITGLVQDLEWSNSVAQTGAEFFDLNGVQQKFSREVIEAATRVNYGQNLDEIHAVESLASLAANNAAGVKGGNFQLFRNFLAHSGAKVHLNTTVVSITETRHNTWTVKTTSPDGDSSKEYEDVIIATPYHSSGISLSGAPSWSLTASAEPDRILPIPPQPYVRLHVTLLTTTSPHPSPEYFGLPPGSTVPQSVLTTYENARIGGIAPEFNSLTYHGKISTNRDEYVVKIFSKSKIEDDWLKRVFGEVGWVHRKEWDAYPVLPPTTTFPPIHLAPGLHYVNAFEPLISTMETETLAARNVVDQLFRARYGVDICGEKRSYISGSIVSAPPPEPPAEADSEQGYETFAPAADSDAVGGDIGQQQVLTAAPVETLTEEDVKTPAGKTKGSGKKETHAKAKSTREEEKGYVYGWDC